MKNKRFVLAFYDGSLAGFDQSSGGYEYKAYDVSSETPSLFGVAFFSTREKAEEKLKVYHNLVVKEFNFEII